MSSGTIGQREEFLLSSSQDYSCVFLFISRPLRLVPRASVLESNARCMFNPYSDEKHTPEVAQGPGEKRMNNESWEHDEACVPSSEDDFSDLAAAQGVASPIQHWSP